jgi:hypothetical protein
MHSILRQTWCRSLLAIGGGLFAFAAQASSTGLPAWLTRAAQGADPQVLSLALRATSCATQLGMQPSSRLAVIDYSKPSTVPRLWVFDLSLHRLLFHDFVAHGRNSGENFATSFSNDPGSAQTSLGLFRTLGTYFGHDGYSLRMDGLEHGVNDNALSRAIVIHGADYVNPMLAGTQGRIGRSLGCPALRRAVAPKVINALKDGQYVFAYYPDRNWLQSSEFLHCDGQMLAGSS